MTRKEVRDELKQVRYYYANQEVFDKSLHKTGCADFLNIVDKYNKLIVHADVRTYRLYASLYLESNTQVGVAQQWGYTPEHVQYLHRSLLEYFVNELNKEVK